MKKLDRSTSFFVALQVISYEKRWANMASESGMPSPPKKKKLIWDEFLVLKGTGMTYKNGIHIKFSTKAHTMFFCPSRYCRNV